MTQMERRKRKNESIKRGCQKRMTPTLIPFLNDGFHVENERDIVGQGRNAERAKSSPVLKERQPVNKKHMIIPRKKLPLKVL